MPRIPQGEFDTNISTRVGAIQQGQSASSETISGMGKAVVGLTGMMAQLQDQTERTEAFAAANKIKRDYQIKKVQYAAALETVRGDGMADYFDPTDTTTDITKKRRIQRPIKEMFAELSDSYIESKKNLSGMAREDIAQDLATQYVGDDLIQLNISTEKQLVRKKEHEAKELINDNMVIELGSFAEEATSPDATPETINLALAKLNNGADRQLGVIGSVIGAEEAKNVRKMRDRYAATISAQIISSGVNNNTIHAADKIVNTITDPAVKHLALSKLENVKKSSSEHTSITLTNTAVGLDQKMRAASFITDQDHMGATMATKNLLSAFTDPKYNKIITDDIKQAKATDLLSTSLAKRMLQSGLEEDLSFLDTEALNIAGPTGIGVLAPTPVTTTDAFGITTTTNQVAGLREPAGNGYGPKRTAMDTKIAAELQASGLDGMLGNAGLSSIVREKTLQKMQAFRKQMKDDLPAVVTNQYPNLTGLAKIEKINQISEAQKFGDPSYVDVKEAAAFKKEYDDLFAKSPSSALNLLEQKLAHGGDATEGTTSYRRAIAMDLASKNSDLAYIIPMSDAPVLMREQMAGDAAAYKRTLAETDATKNHFDVNFGLHMNKVPALIDLKTSSPSMYDGIKQAIINRAATKIKDKNGIDNAMKEAFTEMSELYTSRQSGRVSMLGVNGNGKSYTDKNKLDTGAERAVTLPQLSYEQKIELLKKSAPQVIGKKADGSWNPSPPLNIINDYLKMTVRIEPDGRFPNSHVVKINGGFAINSNNEVLKMSMDDIYNLGDSEEVREQQIRNMRKK